MILENTLVNHYFETICSIPHLSFHEKELSDYIVLKAKENDLEYRQDALHNVIVWIPASEGYEKVPSFMIQGHMDMVGTKAPGIDFDFEKDGLVLNYDGKILRANGTTLGGDDGVATAVMLALMSDKSFQHPLIECVFTTREETGLDGAKELDISKTKSHYLINLDGSGEGEVTVGNYCSDHITLSKIVSAIKEEKDAYHLTISGFVPFAFKEEKLDPLSHPLKYLFSILKKYPYEISELHCGMADNMPPVSVDLSFVMDDKDCDSLIKELQKTLSVEVRKEKVSYHCDEKTRKAIENIIERIPNGPLAFDEKKNMILSFFFGTFDVFENEIRMNGSTRCLNEEENRKIKDELSQVAKDYGYNLEQHKRYSSWPYQKDSVLKEFYRKEVKKYWEKEIKEKICPGGLEVSDFLEKRPDMNIIAIGANGGSFHNSDEWLDILSLNRLYELIKNMLKDSKEEIK